MRAEDWEVLATMRRQSKQNRTVREWASAKMRRAFPCRELMVAALLAVVGACSGGGIEPKTGPGTDYPCGTRGRSCGGDMCCAISEECGYGMGCPAGYCCPLDDDFYGVNKHRQWRAASTSASVSSSAPAK